MTKEKLYLVISFLLNAVIGLCIYSVRLDSQAIRTEMAMTRELLEQKIENVRVLNGKFASK